MLLVLLVRLNPIIIIVGVYDNQVYVQPSYSLQQQVHDATTHAVMTGDVSTTCMPHVHWKPYLATGKCTATEQNNKIVWLYTKR